MTEGSTEEVAGRRPAEGRRTDHRRRNAVPLRPASSPGKSAIPDERRYRLVADLTYDWEYWQGPDGRMLYVSPSCQRITGYAAEEFLDDPTLIDRIIHPDDRARMTEHLHQLGPDGRRLPIDFRVICRDGTERWIGHQCQAVRDENGRNLGVRGSNRDITEQKRIDTELRRSETRYRTLFETMAEGFALHEILCDASGQPCDYRFLEVNPAFERQTGLKGADLIGRTVREVMPDIEPMWIERYGRVALTGKPEQFEAPSKSLGRDFEVCAYQAGSGRFAAVFADITDRKRTQEREHRENHETALANRIFRTFVEYEGDEIFEQALAAVQEGLASEHGIFGYISEPGHLICPSLSRMLDACEVKGKCIHYPPEKWKGLWARALKERHSLYTNEASPVPAGHPKIRNNLAAPILFNGEAIGLLNLANKEGGYTEEDRATLDAIAARIAPVLFAWIQRKLREDERAEAAQALTDSERKYRELIQTANSVVLRWGRDGIIHFINEPGARLLGYEPDELIGRSVQTLVPEVESTGRDLSPLVQDILDHPEQYIQSPNENLRKDGTRVWIAWTNKTTTDAEGNVREVLAIGNEITALKEAEEAVRWSARRAEVLSDTAARLLRSSDPQALVEDLCREVMDFLDCQTFFNFLVDQQAGRLRLNACAGIPDQEASKIKWLDYGVAVCGCVARDRQRAVVEDVSTTDDPRTELIQVFGIQAYCCHPLMVRDRLIGTLSFGTTSRTRFSDEEIGVMKAVADLVAIAMQRVETETALRQSQEDLARAQAVGQIGSWRLDLRRNLLTWSDENCRIFGVPEGMSMTYERFLEIVHPDDRTHVDTGWQACLRGEPYDIEHRIVVEGRIKWVREKAYLEFDDGELVGGFGIAQDITERKGTERALQEANEQLQAQAEELAAINEELQTQTEELQRQTLELRRSEGELRRSESRMRAMLDHMPVGIWFTDSDGKIIYGNEVGHSIWAGAKYVGPEEFHEYKAWWFETGEPVAPQDWAVVRAVRKGQTSLNEILEIECFDGTHKIIHNSAVPMRDGDGQILGCVILNEEITDRKQMEEALRRMNDELEEEVQSQTEELKNTVVRLKEEVLRRRLAEKDVRERSQLLEGFFRNTITPLAFMDRQFNFVRVNDAYARADGKTPEEFVGKNHFALYPSAENRAIFEEVVRTKQLYFALARPFAYAEYPERGISYWNWQLTPLLDEAGEVQYLVLNLQDVTERQAAMEELKTRTSQLQRLTAELSETEDRERHRLAELLHDDLQQLLVGSKLRLSMLTRKTRDMPEIREPIQEAIELLAESIQKSRGLSHELSPPVLHHGNLTEVLRWLGEQIYTTCGLKVHLRVADDADIHSQALKTFAYKTVREMLFNIVKHANVKRAAVVVRRVDQAIRLTVADRGRGFDPQRLDVASQNGFGLFHIRERLQLLGGALTVRSAPGRGSRFVLTIPVDMTENTDDRKIDTQTAPASSRETKRSKAGNRASRHTFRILIVDDHKVMRDGLAALLEEESDIEVVGQAGNGREAITLTAQLKPDVVIMDVVMPIINGEEATRQIKKRWPEVRIVALSMLEEDATRERMLEAGAEAFVSKAGPSEIIAAAIRRSS